ncbi:MAG: Lrp/AsnC family transcriptional regulator [Bacteroidia bacterium]
MKLDKNDLRIIELLNQDARCSYTTMAKDLGITSTAVQQRVKRLFDDGIIKKSTIVLNYEALGYKLLCYIGIYVIAGKYTYSVGEALQDVPEITLANFTTGAFAIICRVRLKDPAHLKKVLKQIQDIEGVQRTETLMSFEEIKNKRDDILSELES